MSALKRGCSQNEQRRTRGGGGSKKDKFGRTYFLNGPESKKDQNTWFETERRVYVKIWGIFTMYRVEGSFWGAKSTLTRCKNAK